MHATRQPEFVKSQAADKKASTVRIAVGQWYSGLSACDQCCKGCGVKLGRGRTRIFAGQRAKDRSRHSLCIDRLRLEAAGGKHSAAFLRKLRHRKRPARLTGPRRWLHGSCNRCPFQSGEPVGEFLSAAIVATQSLLTFTVACFRRTADSHMEMVIVVPPWAHLGQPAPVIASLLTQHLLDCWMHEDAIDLWVRS